MIKYLLIFYLSLNSANSSSFFKSCSDTVVESHPQITCDKEFFRLPDDGFLKFASLKENLTYINFLSKVANKVNLNLKKNELYTKCVSECFRGKSSCSTMPEVVCIDLKEKVRNRLNKSLTLARKYLALSDSKTSLINETVLNVKKLNFEKRINSKLTEFEIDLPNPFRKVPLLEVEKTEIEKFLEDEKKEPISDYEFIKKVEKRKEEFRHLYRKIVFEDEPVLTVLGDPLDHIEGKIPTWSDESLAFAFLKLNEKAIEQQEVTSEALNTGKLEFGRINGEALKYWMLELIPTQKNHYDLLAFASYLGPVDEVLKENPEYCQIAEVLYKRLSNKNSQNDLIAFLSGFFGGSVSKGLIGTSKSLISIGRALTSREARLLTGAAMGGAYLDKSVGEYNTAKDLTNLKIEKTDKIEEKRKKIKNNLLIAPSVTAVFVAKKEIIGARNVLLKFPKKMVEGAKEQWKYILLNAGIQIGSEAMVNYEKLKGKNFSEFVKNFYNDKDIRQNLTFMFSDTLLMTGVSGSVNSFKSNMLISGFIGMSNSTITNVVIKDEENFKRIALDASWESLIGSSQVYLDTKAIKKYTDLADKSNNPKIKLIGYAFAVVDQGLGYMGYSLASKAVANKTETETDNEKKANLILVPVLSKE